MDQWIEQREVSNCRGKRKTDWNNLACLKSVWSPVADLRITKVQSPFILLKSCALALIVLKKIEKKRSD